MRDKINKYSSIIWDISKVPLLISSILVIILLGYFSPLILLVFGSEEWGILSWEFWLAAWAWVLYLVTAYIAWLFVVMFSGGSCGPDEW